MRSKKLFALVLAMSLAACATPTPAPGPAPARATATFAAPSAAGAGQQFVSAINQNDFATAFELLDANARAAVLDAKGLQQKYDDVKAIAQTSKMVFVPQGLLQDGPQAALQLRGDWQSDVFGAFAVTATLPMTFAGGFWQIMWTRDAIAQGLAGGSLGMSREVPPRGLVLAADGSTLAGIKPIFTLGIQPGLVKDAQVEREMLADLSRVLKLGANEIQSKYKGQPADWFIPIADVSEATVDANSAIFDKYEATIVRSRAGRAYPQPSLAPHVTGYVGAMPASAADDYRAQGFAGDEPIGLSGVEASMNTALMGKPGLTLQLFTREGKALTLAQRPFSPPMNVTLTISPAMQTETQRILGQAKNPGAAVVMDVRTGAVLAMASYPAFDISVFSNPLSSTQRVGLLNNAARPLFNRAAQGAYPAGSAFKMVTMAAGLGEDVTAPGDVFYDPGYWDGLGSAYRKFCWLRSGHGRITLTGGLTASCNIVFYEVGKRLDQKSSDLLPAYARQFGFGEKTGIELAAESAGVVPDPQWKNFEVGEPWTPGDTVNMSIGQGFLLVTPLQLAQMTAAIANGGTLIQPRLVASVAPENGAVVQTLAPQVAGHLPASVASLKAIKNGMVGVTTNAALGTAQDVFASFNYFWVDGKAVPQKSLTAAQARTAQKIIVAGKTGTAQAAGASAKPFAWFTAFVPADDPQIAVSVMLENIGEGSEFAAPLARQMIEAYFGGTK
ncbi:MAG TPA: penicillin-binding transpeptidase domain-containing protein [Thermoflexales bacterium]|nr:penicillin-binding transpeptidase domain-containing protein [Thermoflexales bacterium]HQW35315.1 penicillin-binding transpeptidase domain-containing protein [Thermoflexales bacterium]HRA00069.1 penicillin-binding transpeptidase domain-containing protein [Thermoflexales bacterium]